MASFYSYLYLRENLSPYYAGKGQGKRAFHSPTHTVRPPKDKSRIVIFPMLNEAEAFESEIALIELFGRKDNGTGILRNMTDGGDGSSGYKHTIDARKKMSLKRKGRTLSDQWKRHISAAGVGRKQSAETIQKRSNSLRGRILSQASRTKISQSLLGNIPWNKGRTSNVK